MTASGGSVCWRAAVFDVVELELGFVVSLIAVSFLGFVVTSAVGLGSAIFLVPLFMLRLPAAYAVSLATPITLVGNLSRAYMLRQHIDKRAAWIVSLSSAPVSAVAAWFIVDVDPVFLKRGVGSIVLLSLALDSFRPGALKIGRVGLAVSGVIAGILSGLAGLAGPPGVIAMRAYGLSGEAFVATLALWGVALQATKIPAYMVTGAMPLALLPLALVLCVLSFVGAWVATRFLARMRGDTFRVLLNGVLALAALWLIGETLWTAPG